MKIEHNQETKLFIDNIAKSMNESVQFNRAIKGLVNRQILLRDERTIVDAYKEYGVNINSIKYKTRDLTDNPYYKNIRFDNIKSNKVKYDIVTLPPRVLIGMGFTKYADNLAKSYIDIGYFDKSVKIPTLTEGEQIWMSPTISEQRTIQPHIDKAKGNVLTFGLGIGYYVYMCLLKDGVDSITIVEINKDIIDVFNEYIKPQFPKADKIKIIHGDMYDYFNDEFMGSFDTVFVDIWQNNTDGYEHYIKLQSIGVKMDNIGYWIEESILEPVRLALVGYLKAQYTDDYLNLLNRVSRDTFRELVAIHTYFSNKDIVYSTYDQLVELVNDINTLREISKHIA